MLMLLYLMKTLVIFSISGNILQQSEKLFIHTIILIMLGNRIIYHTVLFYFEIQFFEAKSY